MCWSDRRTSGQISQLFFAIQVFNPNKTKRNVWIKDVWSLFSVLHFSIFPKSVLYRILLSSIIIRTTLKVLLCLCLCMFVSYSVESVNDGLFHTVELLIQNHSLSLVVDNGAPKSLGKLARQPSVDHNTQLYIGGKRTHSCKRAEPADVVFAFALLLFLWFSFTCFSAKWAHTNMRTRNKKMRTHTHTHTPWLWWASRKLFLFNRFSKRKAETPLKARSLFPQLLERTRMLLSSQAVMPYFTDLSLRAKQKEKATVYLTQNITSTSYFHLFFYARFCFSMPHHSPVSSRSQGFRPMWWPQACVLVLSAPRRPLTAAFTTFESTGKFRTWSLDPREKSSHSHKWLKAG